MIIFMVINDWDDKERKFFYYHLTRNLFADSKESIIRGEIFFAILRKTGKCISSLSSSPKKTEKRVAGKKRAGI